MFFRTVSLAFISGIIAAGSGCGPAQEPPPIVYKAEGAIVSAGGKPYTGGGAIEFRHETKDGVRSFGEIQPDGTFVLHTITAQKRVPGAQDGAHVVTIIPSSPDQSIQPFTLQKRYTIVAGDNSLKVLADD